MSLAVEPFSFVLVSVWSGKLASSLRLVFLPVSIVLSFIRQGLNTLAVFHVIFKLANVLGAVLLC